MSDEYDFRQVEGILGLVCTRCEQKILPWRDLSALSAHLQESHREAWDQLRGRKLSILWLDMEAAARAASAQVVDADVEEAPPLTDTDLRTAIVLKRELDVAREAELAARRRVSRAEETLVRWVNDYADFAESVSEAERSLESVLAQYAIGQLEASAAAPRTVTPPSAKLGGQHEVLKVPPITFSYKPTPPSGPPPSEDS